MDNKKDNVIPIEAGLPHACGWALCLYCLRSWVAVFPVGTSSLECPGCDTRPRHALFFPEATACEAMKEDD